MGINISISPLVWYSPGSFRGCDPHQHRRYSGNYKKPDPAMMSLRLARVNSIFSDKQTKRNDTYAQVPDSNVKNRKKLFLPILRISRDALQQEKHTEDAEERMHEAIQNAYPGLRKKTEYRYRTHLHQHLLLFSPVLNKVC